MHKPSAPLLRAHLWILLICQKRAGVFVFVQVAHKVQFDDADELAHIEELLGELGPEPEGGDEEDKASFASESEEEGEEAMEV